MHTCRTIYASTIWRVMSSVWTQYRRYMYSLVAELTLGGLDSFLQLTILRHFCATWPPDRAQLGWIHGPCTEEFLPCTGWFSHVIPGCKEHSRMAVHCTSLSCGTKVQVVVSLLGMPKTPSPPILYCFCLVHVLTLIFVWDVRNLYHVECVTRVYMYPSNMM